MKTMMENAAQHSVHPTGGTLRVFRQFFWLEVGSRKVAFSRPAHQRVTQAVGCFNMQEEKWHLQFVRMLDARIQFMYLIILETLYSVLDVQVLFE
jgi:hypothetical protein